jgi:hypothetical protein
VSFVDDDITVYKLTNIGFVPVATSRISHFRIVPLWAVEEVRVSNDVESFCTELTWFYA